MRATLSCRPLDRLRSRLLPGVALLLACARLGWAQSAQAAKSAAPATPAAGASQAKPDSASQAKADSGKKATPEQLQMLVAPVALYPDDLLMQTLVASTYPLEIVQLQQWMAKNPGLKDKALADSVAKQPWDPSIQSMAALPEGSRPEVVVYQDPHARTTLAGSTMAGGAAWAVCCHSSRYVARYPCERTTRASRSPYRSTMPRKWLPIVSPSSGTALAPCA